MGAQAYYSWGGGGGNQIFFFMEENGQVKADLGKCNLKCSKILVSNPATSVQRSRTGYNITLMNISQD